MIYREYNFSTFCDEFYHAKRDYYTYEAKKVMYEYYDNLGYDFEMDVVAICGECTEYYDMDLWGEFGDGEFNDEEFEVLLEQIQEGGATVLETEIGTYVLIKV